MESNSPSSSESSFSSSATRASAASRSSHCSPYSFRASSRSLAILAQSSHGIAVLLGVAFTADPDHFQRLGIVGMVAMGRAQNPAPLTRGRPHPPDSSDGVLHYL